MNKKRKHKFKKGDIIYYYDCIYKIVSIRKHIQYMGGYRYTLKLKGSPIPNFISADHLEEVAILNDEYLLKEEFNKDLKDLIEQE